MRTIFAISIKIGYKHGKQKSNYLIYFLKKYKINKKQNIL